jgi:FkbM family methyltransferase
VTIVSYAQNFEDVILWRVLKHIQKGFYIDIGANDPVVDSVSLAFYEQGWRGLHVEPMPQYAQELRSARPDEDVIEAAIGVGQTCIQMFEIADTGLSTGCSAVAQEHAAHGYAVRPIDVSCVPLSEILDVQGDRPIHWLKIDVEGMEDQVIESWLPSSVRPWVVLVESTRPNSAEPNFSVWEPALLALGYEFVYFDGLNRFYVSVQHPELKAAFGPGPNYFDGFVLSGLSSAPFCHKVNLG